METQVLQKEIEEAGILLDQITQEMSRHVVGQKELLEGLLIALLCGQHVLIEGVPGLAKTLTVNTLARIIGGSFGRIQFTPDLLPADILGTQIYNPQAGNFYPKKGPVFTNILLADEINRAPAKVQSALLEAMQERQVTIGDDTFKLDTPFLVLATQNPIDQEGTYPLPEAQVDRFMMKLLVSYPQRDEELQILRSRGKRDIQETITSTVSPEALNSVSRLVDCIYMDSAIEEYIVDIVQATRQPKKYNLDLEELMDYGVSPRATIFLALAAKARALMAGRAYVVPGDVLDTAPHVLRHRIILSYEALAEEITSDQIIAKILKLIPVP